MQKVKEIAMYYVHYAYDEKRGLNSFKSLKEAMDFVCTYMHEWDILPGIAVDHFTVIEGKKLMLGVRPVSKTIMVDELVVEDET